MEHCASEENAIDRKQTAVLHAGGCVGSLQVIPCILSEKILHHIPSFEMDLQFYTELNAALEKV